MICAIVLAAGRSRRMGVQKLLLTLDGKPLLRGIVEGVLTSAVDEVFVVVGPAADEVTPVLDGCRVRFVVNPDAGSQMLGSVRCALRALPASATAALVVLGDQPRISSSLIDQMLAECRCGRKIVVPTFEGRRGHPLLFALDYRHELLESFDAVGLRGLLQAHPDDLYELPFGSRQILEDLDVPEDFLRAAGKRLTKSVKIRRAAGNDAAAMWAVRSAAIAQIGTDGYTSHEIQEWAACPMPYQFDEVIEAGDFVVAECQGAIVGFGAIDRQTAEIIALFVRPDCWRRGIGRQLLDWLEALAQAAGLGWLRLSSSLHAAAFYRFAGYTTLEATQFHHPSGLVLGCILMEKKLPGSI